MDRLFSKYQIKKMKTIFSIVKMAVLKICTYFNPESLPKMGIERPKVKRCRGRKVKKSLVDRIM